MSRHWYKDHDEFTDFARALVAANAINAETLLDYMERPWRWAEEHAAWVAAGRPAIAPVISDEKGASGGGPRS